MIEYPVDQLPQLINDLLQCDTTERKNKLLIDAQQTLSTELYLAIHEQNVHKTYCCFNYPFFK